MSRKPTARRRARWLGATLLFGLALATSFDVAADDSLSTSLFDDDAQALWPLELAVEFAFVDAKADVDRSTRASWSQTESALAKSGHLTTFAHTERTSTGERTITATVVGRHHPGGRVELEYDVRVRESRFAAIGVSEYVLHRLGWGATPVLGPSALRISRADIVSVANEPHRESFEIDGDRYEVRLFATSTRG